MREPASDCGRRRSGFVEVDHWLACADVAIELEDRQGRVMSERDLRFEEMVSGREIASAKLVETLDAGSDEDTRSAVARLTLPRLGRQCPSPSVLPRE